MNDYTDYELEVLGLLTRIADAVAPTEKQIREAEHRARRLIENRVFEETHYWDGSSWVAKEADNG